MSATFEPSVMHPTLASARLPRRVRRALEQVYTLAADDMARGLERMLAEFEQQLFRQADQAVLPAQQQGYFDTLRLVRQNRADLIPRFLSGLEAALAEIRAPESDEVTEAPEARAHFGELRLVDNHEIEEGSALRAIAARHEARANLPLHLLGQRFGVLACASAFDAERLPVGPHRLGTIMAQASKVLQIDPQPRLELFRCFDQHAMQSYTHLVETINATLVRERILPDLVYVPVRVRPTVRAELTGEAMLERREQSHAYAMGPRSPYTGWYGGEGAASAGDHGDGRGAAMSGHGIEEAEAGTHDGAERVQPKGSPAGGRRPSTGATSQPAQAGSRSGATPAPAGNTGAANRARGNAAGPANGRGTDTGHGDGGDLSDFAQLQQMLAARRGLLGKLSPGGKNPNGDANQLSTEDVMRALARMQDSAANAGADPQAPRSVHDVRQALLAQTRQLRGQAAALSREDNDAFELLGLLLEEIQRQLRRDAPSTRLLHKLVVPLLRLVLNDRGFFVEREHPARQLLNAVAESGAAWLPEEEADPQLNDQLHSAVDDVITRFQGDATVFQDVNQRVQQHLHAMARRAEVTERRHVDAARGKEKLELAKHHASEVIAAASRDHRLPRFVQSLLATSWADVLTLTLLRHDEDSAEWQQQLIATRAIVRASALDHPTPPPADLAAQVERSLTLVGYHADEAGEIARRLTASVDDDSDEPTSRTELAMKLKARSRLGPEAPAPRPELPPRTQEEESAYQVLRTLPFGTWFEFVTNQQGDVVRRRLSWYSPLTDHALFVNQRGQRAGEQSLDSLARAVAQDQARIVTIEHSSLIDRAWQSALSALRGFMSGAQIGGNA